MKLEKLAHFQSELTFLVKWSPGQYSNRPGNHLHPAAQSPEPWSHIGHDICPYMPDRIVISVYAWNIDSQI